MRNSPINRWLSATCTRVPLHKGHLLIAFFLGKLANRTGWCNIKGVWLNHLFEQYLLICAEYFIPPSSNTEIVGEFRAPFLFASCNAEFSIWLGFVVFLFFSESREEMGREKAESGSLRRAGIWKTPRRSSSKHYEVNPKPWCTFTSNCLTQSWCSTSIW